MHSDSATTFFNSFTEKAAASRLVPFLPLAGYAMQVSLAGNENPVESCPHESAEGGYQYIYGGPSEANEELSSEFAGIVADDVIEELSGELDDITPYWSGSSTAFDPDLDDYLFRSSAESLGHKDAFNESALNIERLLETKVEAADRQCLLRLLYVNVITALETYLSDKFISSVTADEKLLRKFGETTPEFENENLPLSKVFSARESIQERVQKHLLEVVWHRLAKVEPMFRDTLGIYFPSDMKELHLAVIVRHDCVHRNGKTKAGKEHVLDENSIKTLLSHALNQPVEGLFSILRSRARRHRPSDFLGLRSTTGPDLRFADRSPYP